MLTGRVVQVVCTLLHPVHPLRGGGRHAVLLKIPNAVWGRLGLQLPVPAKYGSTRSPYESI